MTRSHIFGLFAISIIAVACAPQEIVVADVDALHDAAPDGPPACAKNEDCNDTDFCKKDGCDALTGTCTPRRADCPTDEGHAVCGCSGTTYWNDCVAGSSGDNIRALNECPMDEAQGCHSSAACTVPGAYCALLFFKGNPCDPAPPQSGKCWRLPDGLCDTHPGPGPWTQCIGSQHICVDRCSAIRSGFVAVQFAMGCH